MTVAAGDGTGLPRCGWAGSDPEYQRYHDEEWGFPLHGDAALFEKISLEGFQSGLSWITILKRRPAFREAFHGFDIERVARLTDDEVEELMNNTGIIRNRAKILATRANARITRDLIANAPGALDDIVWGARPLLPRPRPQTAAEIPATTAESTALSTTLRALGYRFVGPTTMYALMQSAGVVDDHVVGCWRAQPASRAVRA
ncbi:DNA-3-methyladenine glycosylase I [Glaciihabitans tibetensis]|uniref:DNA-3-methyladenine glycosylase I n=1 Tax=Glaciihabitans tibetensis TaxID=1266600 RepID=A0A2T0VHC5_9MICO|nr:DNA-3-methyladenine glycosylase I [Glaciihabitans tibetensis]PRY69609.1 DNA-3-methyladenine glycosylase I [Glaciihabitans tibetensis]